MPQEIRPVAPGVQLTQQFRLRVDFIKALEWWQMIEQDVFNQALADKANSTFDPRPRIIWGLVLAGLEAAGIKVEQVEEEWGIAK